MIKKTSILALAFCLFLTILSPVLVQAQDGLTVLDSSIQVEINIEQMSQEQRDKFAKMAKEGWKL